MIWVLPHVAFDNVPPDKVSRERICKAAGIFEGRKFTIADIDGYQQINLVRNNPLTQCFTATDSPIIVKIKWPNSRFQRTFLMQLSSSSVV